MRDHSSLFLCIHRHTLVPLSLLSIRIRQLQTILRTQFNATLDQTISNYHHICEYICSAMCLLSLTLFWKKKIIIYFCPPTQSSISLRLSPSKSSNVLATVLQIRLIAAYRIKMKISAYASLVKMAAEKPKALASFYTFYRMSIPSTHSPANTFFTIKIAQNCSDAKALPHIQNTIRPSYQVGRPDAIP